AHPGQARVLAGDLRVVEAQIAPGVPPEEAARSQRHTPFFTVLFEEAHALCRRTLRRPTCRRNRGRDKGSSWWTAAAPPRCPSRRRSPPGGEASARPKRATPRP